MTLTEKAAVFWLKEKDFEEMYSYEEIIRIFENSRRFGKKPGVEVSKIMLEKLGHPEAGLSYIHVAGTNGKGSVCAFLNSVFIQAGLRTGCFTSPHLTDFRERITVDGKMIEREAVERIGNRLLSVSFGVSPTMFDYCLMLAVLYFKERQCDAVIMETGLGGRLDSTNALGRPVLSVITKIGYDHMAALGSTLAEIAGEKAGILKPGVPAVFAPQEAGVLAVLQQAQRKCNPVSNERRSDYEIYAGSEDINQVRDMQPGLSGVYQYENAAAAMLAAREYFKRCKAYLSGKSPADEEHIMRCIRDGIHMAYWPGRMELLSEQPFLLVDGAHNSSGVYALKKSLEAMYPGEKFHFIMGVMADKDYEEMIEILFPLALDFLTVTPESERALQGKQLAERIRAHGIFAKNIEETDKVPAFLSMEKTVAFGSLYFIGELKKLKLF